MRGVDDPRTPAPAGQPFAHREEVRHVRYSTRCPAGPGPAPYLIAMTGYGQGDQYLGSVSVFPGPGAAVVEFKTSITPASMTDPAVGAST